MVKETQAVKIKVEAAEGNERKEHLLWVWQRARRGF